MTPRKHPAEVAPAEVAPTPEELEAQLLAALESLAAQGGEGPMVARGEFALDMELNNVLIAYADVLGGGMRRSVAIRALLREGALARLAKLRRTAARRA